MNGQLSCWEAVISGELQGSVAVLYAFPIYINDLDGEIVLNLYMFAGDFVLGGIVGYDV